MPPIPKRLLVIGLLNAPKSQTSSAAVDPEELRKAVQAEFKKAREAGFDVEVSLCDDTRFDHSLSEIKKKLEGNKYDGISIGNGVRGISDYTVFFEDLVNVCREIQPQTRLCFNSRPGDLFEAIVRNFGQSGHRDE